MKIVQKKKLTFCNKSENIFSNSARPQCRCVIYSSTFEVSCYECNSLFHRSNLFIIWKIPLTLTSTLLPISLSFLTRWARCLMPNAISSVQPLNKIRFPGRMQKTSSPLAFSALFLPSFNKAEIWGLVWYPFIHSEPKALEEAPEVCPRYLYQKPAVCASIFAWNYNNLSWKPGD